MIVSLIQIYIAFSVVLSLAVYEVRVGDYNEKAKDTVWKVSRVWAYYTVLMLLAVPVIIVLG